MPQSIEPTPSLPSDLRSSPRRGHMELSQQEQFVALFIQNEAAIHSFVLTLIPSLQDSEEIVQEASMTMWRRFEQYQPGTSFRNWAFQIAKYTTFNYVRKQSRDRHRFSEKMMELLASHAESSQEVNESRRRALEHCITKLPDRDRHVLAGCYREGSTIKAFAESDGRTANAVTKHLNRIRRTLSKCVRQSVGAEGAA